MHHAHVPRARRSPRSQRWVALSCATILAALPCIDRASDETVATSDESFTAVPETPVRDQKDSGDCWLFATTGWVESLEYGALVQSAGTDTIVGAPAQDSQAFDGGLENEI